MYAAKIDLFPLMCVQDSCVKQQNTSLYTNGGPYNFLFCRWGGGGRGRGHLFQFFDNILKDY